jgi:hypothetical protein
MKTTTEKLIYGGQKNIDLNKSRKIIEEEETSIGHIKNKQNYTRKKKRKKKKALC